jgi:glycosyltransferase involved in cell wall biosynthesis
MSNAAITVLLATRNGEHVLPRVLAGYRRAVAPTAGWNMVIVDNGSTDATAQIIEAARAELPLDILNQPVAGKNRALNTGIEAAFGRLVLLVDDDAIPRPTFLTAWAKYLETNLDYELFGGTIDPLFETAPPDWMLKGDLPAMLFAERKLPEGPTAWDAIFGPNMAVRKSVFDSGLRFDENIGPNALDDVYPTGGESEFCRRVAQRGARSWFAQEPAVQHIVRPVQLTMAMFIKRAYRTGRARAYIMWKDGKLETANVARPGMWERFRQLYRLRLKMFSPWPDRVEVLRAYHVARGFRDECVKRGLEPNRAPTGRITSTTAADVD